jgi:hypothetical protein
MPLAGFEREVLQLLAVNRNPDSYVAGATVLNQSANSPRTSKDVDVFHDTIGSLSQSADRDIATLKTTGYEVLETGRRHDTFCRAAVRRGGQQTKWFVSQIRSRSLRCFWPGARRDEGAYP